MNDIDSDIKLYEKNRPLYESLAIKVADVIKENLEQGNIQYHSVTSRAKPLDSFEDKAKSGKYSYPIEEIKDIAGIRVITYLESDVKRVAAIIENLFEIDKANSLDQSKLLGKARVGYRSVHYVAEFDKTRCELPEYKKYEDLPFEIQIRSLLQHAWAEIEHPRNYKFRGKLPTELQRRFYLVAGMLEVADREFVLIAQEVDKYKNTLVAELSRGGLDVDINTESLRAYLQCKLKKLESYGRIYPIFGRGDLEGREIVEEVELFGILNLYELDKIIPSALDDNLAELSVELHYSPDFCVIMRSILIILDTKKYFEVSWRHNWQSDRSIFLKLLERYNVDIEYLRKYIYVHIEDTLPWHYKKHTNNK